MLNLTGMAAGRPLRLFGLIGVWFLAGITKYLPAAEPISCTFDAATGTLIVTFGSGDDVARFTFDNTNNRIQLQTDSANIFTPGPYLVANGNRNVTCQDVKKMVIDFGAGNDKMIEPILNAPPLLIIYGGPGNDVLKTPAGAPVAYIYGGPGDDMINAEHSKTNYVYGEDGNDTMYGSSDGPNFMDGGAGSNIIYTFPANTSGDPNSIQTVFYHEGARDMLFDMGGPNIYKLLPSGGAPVPGGTLAIYEMSAASFDTLDFSAWKRTVSPIDLASSNPQVVSTDGSGTAILTLQFGFYANRVEKVIYPVVNQAPVANAQNVTTAEDAAKSITLSATDPDNGPSPLSLSIVNPPTHGALNGAGANWTYTPAANYFGSDGFTFKAFDGAADSNIATVTITITAANDSPVIQSQPSANPNPAKTGQSVSFFVAASDVDGDALTYAWTFGDGSSGSGPAPTHAYSSTGTFTASVTVTDGKGGSASGSVAVTVTASDTAGPVLALTSVVLKGTVSDPSGVASLTVNGAAVSLNPDGSWQKEVALSAGSGTTGVNLVAKDTLGNTRTQTVSIAK